MYCWLGGMGTGLIILLGVGTYKVDSSLCSTLKQVLRSPTVHTEKKNYNFHDGFQSMEIVTKELLKHSKEVLRKMYHY